MIEFLIRIKTKIKQFFCYHQFEEYTVNCIFFTAHKWRCIKCGLRQEKRPPEQLIKNSLQKKTDEF